MIRKLGKYGKTIRLQRRQARGRPRIISYFFFLNPRKTQWKHVLYISIRFFIDESS